MISNSEHILSQHHHIQQQHKPIEINIKPEINNGLTFPANMISVALFMPSTKDSLQPYKLSNLLCNKNILLPNWLIQ